MQRWDFQAVTLTSMFTQLLWPVRRCTGVMLCVSHTVTDDSWPQAQTWLRPMGTSVRIRSGEQRDSPLIRACVSVCVGTKTYDSTLGLTC